MLQSNKRFINFQSFERRSTLSLGYSVKFQVRSKTVFTTERISSIAHQNLLINSSTIACIYKVNLGLYTNWIADVIIASRIILITAKLSYEHESVFAFVHCHYTEVFAYQDFLKNAYFFFIISDHILQLFFNLPVYTHPLIHLPHPT